MVVMDKDYYCNIMKHHLNTSTYQIVINVINVFSIVLISNKI